jgi:hypothetical protein
MGGVNGACAHAGQRPTTNSAILAIAFSHAACPLVILVLPCCSRCLLCVTHVAKPALCATVERIGRFYRGKFQSRVIDPPERLIFAD